jgi:hypothetical protein
MKCVKNEGFLHMEISTGAVAKNIYTGPLVGMESQAV